MIAMLHKMGRGERLNWYFPAGGMGLQAYIYKTNKRVNFNTVQGLVSRQFIVRRDYSFSGFYELTDAGREWLKANPAEDTP